MPHDVPVQIEEPVVGVRGHRVRDLRKAQQRREDILMAAAQVFARRGYDAANVEDIANEAGVAKGHIYHYFLSKEQIFTEIRAGSIAVAIEALEDVIAAGGTPREMLREALTRLIWAVFEPVIEHYAIVLADPADLGEESRARIRELQRRYEDLFRGILEQGIRQGQFVDEEPKLMLFTLLRAALGLGAWYRPGGLWDPEWVKEKVVEQLVRSVTRFE